MKLLIRSLLVLITGILLLFLYSQYTAEPATDTQQRIQHTDSNLSQPDPYKE